MEAHSTIKDKLLSPTTADFPSCLYSSKEHNIANWGGNKFMMLGYVDSQNIYGAQIRQKWWVILQQSDALNFRSIDSGFRS